jgi:Na+/melibiose symporter-like transporter
MSETALERQDVGPRAAARVLRSPNFGPYFFGNAASASGTWFQNLAASLLVYRLTHSAFLLGVVNFSQFIRILVLAPWAGALADRFDRRRLLLLTQVAAAAVAGALAVLAWNGANEWVVIGFVFATGVTSAFSAPASQALIVQLVEERDVPQAVALNSMTYNLAGGIGPASAAAAIAWLGIPPAFLLNAFSYLLLVGALLVVHPREQERDESPSLRESLSLLRRDPRLAAFLVIVMCVGFASDPVNTLAPAFANAFGHPDTLAGVLIGVFGAGAVCAAFVVAGRVAGSRERLVATLALLGFGLIAFSLCPWAPRRARTAVPRGLRLPRVEHRGDDASAAWCARDAAWPDHGAVVDRVPRPASVRLAGRRRIGGCIRRAGRGRRPRAAGARLCGSDRPDDSR